MPSIQSKAINVLLYLLRMKRTVNRLRQRVYARDVDPKSYLVSPVYGSLKDLAPISVFIGTRDVFCPDCRKLRDKAMAEGVRLDYREYEGMVHEWMLGPLPEAKQTINEIVETIRATDSHR
jgi:monoterpene epsilon-lactone hydrolase